MRGQLPHRLRIRPLPRRCKENSCCSLKKKRGAAAPPSLVRPITVSSRNERRARLLPPASAFGQCRDHCAMQHAERRPVSERQEVQAGLFDWSGPQRSWRRARRDRLARSVFASPQHKLLRNLLRPRPRIRKKVNCTVNRAFWEPGRSTGSGQ